MQPNRNFLRWITVDNFLPKTRKERLFVDKSLFFHFFLEKMEKIGEKTTKISCPQKLIPKNKRKIKKIKRSILVKLSTKNGGFLRKKLANPYKRKVVHNKARRFIHNFFAVWVDNLYLSTKTVENGVLKVYYRLV